MKKDPRNIESIYPLSPVQHGMFVYTSMAPETGVYFERYCWALLGEVNVAALREAWQKVIDRHPVLRTLVWERGNEPVQVVLKHVDAPWENLNWRELDEIQQQERFAHFLVSDLKKGFDLSKAPLMRFTLIQLAENKFHFVWSFHHLILDGWSDALLLKEAGDFYQALLQGRNLDLEPRRPFQDYIKWLRQQDFSQAEVFFREELKGFIAPTTLGLDNGPQRLPLQEASFNKECLDLSENLTTEARAFAMKHHLTLNTVFQGMWAILLSRYSGQSDVLLGTTFYGRPGDLVGANEMLGMFLNTLPFRIQVTPDEPLIPWLKRIQSRFAQLREFEFVPLVQIQGWSEVPRGISLFDSLIVFQNIPEANVLTPFGKGLEVSQLITYDATNYPLEIVVDPGLRLGLRITYDESRFDRATVLWILGHIRTLLEGIVEDPDRSVSTFPIVSRSARRLLRPAPAAMDVVASFVPFKREEINQSVASRFEQQAKKYPKRIAVSTKSEQCTYEQLDHRANQVGNAILACGLGKDDRIALLLDHDGGMIAALMGALKAGITYVPLEPRYPKERLDCILQDSSAAALLANQVNLELAESVRRDGMPLIVLEDILLEEGADRPQACPSAEDLAYILYTSGSTGRPKGVIQNNRNILHYICAYTNALRIGSDDRLSLFSSYSHDAAVMDIFGALLNGATLCPKNIRHDGLLDFETWMADEGIAIYHSIPTLFRNVVQTLTGKRHFPKVRRVVLGGEAVFRSDVEAFRKCFGPNCLFVNVLGPTESTIGSMNFIDFNTQVNRNSVPIGHEIEETEFVLLDDAGHRTDVCGEIAIRSPYLALGYWQNANLTQEAFVPDIYNENRRMYRTGDIARLLPNGSYEFVGRKDFQVKIRGFRIELGEIETLLRQHEAIQEAVVMVREDIPGDQRLVAYVVPAAGVEFSFAALSKQLRMHLPDYMIPATFVRLEMLPLTPNGKVNRKALPKPETARPELEKGFLAPRTPLEEVLAGIWAEVLGVEHVGVLDNFFELGGHSLLVTQVLSRLREALQVEVPIRRIFENPTVLGLAEFILQLPEVRTKIERQAQLLVNLAHLSEDEVHSLLKEKTTALGEGDKQ